MEQLTLCNVLYKILAKVLADRLKRVLPAIISEEQSAFVPGRSITDNVIDAFETIHAMRRKTKGKRGDVAINGEEVGPIMPSRELRQGDLLSPYLFILCAERLSSLLKKAESCGNIHGIRVCRELLKILLKQIWVSKLDTGRYLGLSSLEILLKSVAQAIPFYCTSVFLLPVSFCDELQHIMNSFWWGSKPDGGRRIHWSSWERLCTRKGYGGMDFRHLHNFNVAMLGKQAWSLIANPDALVSKVIKARYFPRGDFFSAQLGSNPSLV
ncbi:uncharacterized protein LOC107261163 [Ricinus communis]|uniref:uncharacterized protein LOC107261163 n=1 Tax=Ricinus communis TaxID=3988 RepID=UPI00077254BA|nr:uncharacterized protein LOC107261163 [Ricinus communis]|eukprot:XP_015573920.1 uncharacterized protein LOC107261163 [Ricinus communis]